MDEPSAAQLLGFVDAWCRRISRARLLGFEHTSFDILEASLRQQLSAESIAEAAAEGALLDWQRAVDLAQGIH